jgi:chemotaxis signal transduction protein
VGVATTTEVLLYYLGQQPLATPQAQIQSVQCCTHPITPICGTPDWLVGVTPACGELLPILNLAASLNLPQCQKTATTLLTCQLSRRQRYGVLISRCVGRFHAHTVEPTIATPVPADLQLHTTGMVQIDDTICPLFDLTSFCADPAMTPNPST